jgi:hypothetical protein
MLEEGFRIRQKRTKRLWRVLLVSLINFLCVSRSDAGAVDTSPIAASIVPGMRLLSKFVEANCDSSGCSTGDDPEIPKMGALLIVPSDTSWIAPYRVICNPDESGEYGFQAPEATRQSIDLPADESVVAALFGNQSEQQKILPLLKSIQSSAKLKMTEVITEKMFSQIEIKGALLGIPARCRSGLLKSAVPVQLIVDRFFGVPSLEVKIRGGVDQTRRDSPVLLLTDLLKANYQTLISKKHDSNVRVLLIRFRHPQLFAFRATPISRLNSDYEALFR